MNKSIVPVLVSALVVIAVWVGVRQFHEGHLLTQIVQSCETDLSRCQQDLKACLAKPSPNPPPGPIIILDPTRPGTPWTINSIAPTCVAMDAGYTNEDHIGVGIAEFSATLSGFTQPQPIKRLRATFNVGGVNHTLEVLRTSLTTLAWKVDGVVLLPEPRNSDQEFPQELCGTLASVQVVRNIQQNQDVWLDPQKITIQPNLP